MRLRPWLSILVRHTVRQSNQGILVELNGLRLNLASTALCPRQKAETKGFSKGCIHVLMRTRAEHAECVRACVFVILSEDNIALTRTWLIMVGDAQFVSNKNKSFIAIITTRPKG